MIDNNSNIKSAKLETQATDKSPNLLSYIEEEQKFIDKLRNYKTRRVEMEKFNEAWLVRFLPVQLGKRNLWYVRQGQHSLIDQSIYCPRCISPDFGGDPKAECPVCEVAELLKADNNENISSLGVTLRANVTYLTYCVVYQIDPGRGAMEDMPEAQILRPWEFHLEVDTFEELMNYFLRGVTASRPYSVLDLVKGNDFWGTKTTKGIRLERQDPGLILDMGVPNYEEKIDRIFSVIPHPKIAPPTLLELEEFANKAMSEAYGDDRSPVFRAGRVLKAYA